MKVLIDEMFPATVAERMRARDHDAVSVHDPDLDALLGTPDPVSALFLKPMKAGRPEQSR